MATSKSSPAVRGDGELTSRRNSHAVSNTSESAPQTRRQSLAALSDSQGAIVTPQETRSSRISTTQSSLSSSLQNAKGTKDTKASVKSATPNPTSNAGLDPLSKQIYERTNSTPAEPSIAQRLRNPGRSDNTSADNIQRQDSELGQSQGNLQDSSRDRRCAYKISG